MPVFAETDLLDACRILFSSDVQINRDFLYYLQPSGIKSAYRKKAKETHPDCFVGVEPEEHERLSEQFRGVSQAYKLLNTFTSNSQKRLWSPADWRTDYRASAARNSGHDYAAGYAAGHQEHAPFNLPRRHLEAGLYLYYRGVISYAEMIEALVWQRRQRPIIGNIAETWGWLKSHDVQAINKHHGRRGRFGARAVDLGYLTQFQVQVLLRHQRQSQKLFAQYFVEQGRLTKAEVEAYMREQVHHNSRYRNTTI